MTLWVDFNRMDARGRVPAVLRGSQAWTLEEGQIVLVEDGEGTCCKASVEELRRAVSGANSVAYLALIPGSVDTDPRIDWFSDDLNEYIDARPIPFGEEDGPEEYENFERLLGGLVQVPNSEVDEVEATRSQVPGRGASGTPDDDAEGQGEKSPR